MKHLSGVVSRNYLCVLMFIAKSHGRTHEEGLYSYIKQFPVGVVIYKEAKSTPWTLRKRLIYSREYESLICGAKELVKWVIV